MRLSASTQVEDLLDHGAVLALQLTRVTVRHDADRVGALVDVDVQTAVGLVDGRARDAAVQALEYNGAGAAREADGVRDGRDSANAGELVLVARHEQHALLVCGVNRQRD